MINVPSETASSVPMPVTKSGQVEALIVPRWTTPSYLTGPHFAVPV